MRITIDNLDGLGAVEYTEAVAAGGPITIQRRLNEPSLCTAEIVAGLGGLSVPARRGRVVVSSVAGTVLFTGYIATTPVRVYEGAGTQGAVYRVRVTAVSDEWLLDKQGSGASRVGGIALRQTAAEIVGQLTSRAQGSAGSVTASGLALATGVSSVDATVPWSVNAGSAAGGAYAGYRAVGAVVQVQTAGTVNHAVSDGDGTLNVLELTTSHVRELTNDVTLTGEEEPTTYVTETFIGDGTTSVFTLSDAVYRDSARTIARDVFAGSAMDATQWAAKDPASAISLTGAGLTLNGGNGQDGGTALTLIDAVEIGGSVVAQMSGVQFGAGTDGVLGGFYEGTNVLANVFAGFRVRQSVSASGTVTVVVPMVNGVEVGTVFTPTAGHAYTLRVRVHSVEMQRVRQQYYCMVDGTIEGFGGGAVAAPADVVLELVDEGASSNTPATVLYDSVAANAPVAVSPATCVFAVASGAELFGSVGGVSVTRPGSGWIVSTLPSGAQETRLIGAAGQGVDCEMTYGSSVGTPGRVTFFAGRVPVANERIAVSYRLRGRSVARIENAASVALEQLAGAPGTCRWLGKVVSPKARTSADCEQAALAVLAMGTSVSAAVAGKYVMVNPASDVWPGDVLAVTSGSVTTSLLIRSVTVRDGASVPEALEYRIAFANDWATEYADGLGLKLSEEIAADAVLPQTAATTSAQVLANLQQLTVTELSTATLQVDAGTAPPAGGGFEVRRKDWVFGLAADPADLVLRSPVRSFAIPRSAQVERFYVRMYDGSTPPVYSRFSSALFVNAPVS